MHYRVDIFHLDGILSRLKLSEFHETGSPSFWRRRSKFLRMFFVEATLAVQLSTSFSFGVMVFQIPVDLETKFLAGKLLMSKLDFLFDTLNCSCITGWQQCRFCVHISTFSFSKQFSFCLHQDIVSESHIPSLLARQCMVNRVPHPTSTVFADIWDRPVVS